MRRKGILVGVIAVFALLSAVLAGQYPGGGYQWWGNREPIYIHGNDAFICENGVVTGCGTAEDPFIIEGWIIDNPPTDYGIYLDHTTAYVVIRDCVVERAQEAGIYLNSVSNVRVEGCRLTLNNTGIYFLNSRYNIVADTVIALNYYGVVMGVSSRDNCITGNSFIDNGLNGLDSEHRSQWHCYGTGNYWSDYDGVDFDGDGVGDRPYFRLADCYPLVCPPTAEAPQEQLPIPPAEMPAAVVAPEPEPVVEPPVSESTPPVPEPEPQPEPEPSVEPTPEPVLPAQTPPAAVTPEPEPPSLEEESKQAPEATPEPEPTTELPIESVPPPEPPQTAPTSSTE